MQSPTLTLTEVKGTFRRLKFTGDGEGKRFVIADVQSPDSGDSFSVKGDADPENLLQGITYRFYGSWGKPKPPWGAPFEFLQLIQEEPHTRTAVVAYLTKYASGIGPVFAGRLWNAYQSRAVSQLRSNPDECADAIGIDRSKARVASKCLVEFAATEDTRLELTSLFDGRGFPKTLVEAVIEKWGIHAPKIIRRDPFTLLVNRLPGCGFDRCDSLYCDLGLPPGRLKRQFAAIWRALKESGSGNTWHPVSVAKQAIEEKISGIGESASKWKRAVVLGVRSKWLASRVDETGQIWIAENRQAQNEKATADNIKRLMLRCPSCEGTGFSLHDDDEPSQCDCLKWPNVVGIDGLTDHQRAELSKAFTGQVGILTGNPGTGKTTAVALTIKAMLQQDKGITVAVASPTNMAAARVRRELSSHGIYSRVTSTTFHKLLGPTRNGRDGSGWGFYHNADRPLELDVLIIDEDSMRDTDISASLLTAIQTGTLVMFLGDTEQLPPVGHGAPLRDFIAAGLPHGHLSEVLRNKGAIADFCKRIRLGMPLHQPKPVNFSTGDNHYHVPCSTPAAQLQALQKMYQHLASKKTLNDTTLDPISDVQTLVAVNAIGELSRKSVNIFIRDILNPNGYCEQGNPFRVGDKIIFTDNCDLQLSDEESSVWGVSNGEMGIVADVSSKHSVIRLIDANQLVVSPVFGTGKKPNGSPELGYAVTVHKSQGSQWRAVFCLTDRAANRLASRELWNTAASRAVDLLVTIGDLSLIQYQSKRIALSERKTFLKELIIE